MIGVALIAEGLGREIPKGYIYFAMAFSVCVEMLNLRGARKRAAKVRPVDLREAYSREKLLRGSSPRVHGARGPEIGMSAGQAPRPIGNA